MLKNIATMDRFDKWINEANGLGKTLRLAMVCDAYYRYLKYDEISSEEREIMPHLH